MQPSAVLLIPVKLSTVFCGWNGAAQSFRLIVTWDWSEWKAISQKSRFWLPLFLNFYSEWFLRLGFAMLSAEQLRWSDCTRLFFSPLLVGLSPQWKKKTCNLQSISATDYTRAKNREKEKEKGARLHFFDWWSWESNENCIIPKGIFWSNAGRVYNWPA